MTLSAATVSAVRNDKIREGEIDAPSTCPQCDGVKVHARVCPWCGHESKSPNRSRKVIETGGRLVAMDVREWRQRRKLEATEALKREWAGAVYGTRKHKPHRSFAQLYANFARNHDWRYPPRDWPQMPKKLIDWYLPVGDSRMDDLHQ